MPKRVCLLSLLVLLAVAPAAAAAGRCGDVATRPWCDTKLDADVRAGLLLGALTRDERISLLAGDELTGVAGREGTHTGTSNGVERVGLPPIYFSDGPVGTRQGKATGMPSPMTVASTFDPALAARHAAVVGDEVRRKGNDVVFAPAVNMMRTPLNGRTFEYFGEDPFLAARIAVGWTKGVQDQGVIANVKHYAVNNQEGQGTEAPGAPIGAGVVGSRVTTDARLDERTLREIYLPQFEAAVKEGGAGSVMCAYNRVNGQYACENQHLLEDVLKRDWAFRGFVLTDYGAGKNTVASLNNGLDLDIYPGIIYRPQLVSAALATSQVSDATIDEHVRRILRTLFAFGFFDREAYPDNTASIDQAGHDAVAADIQQEGTVLLENDGAILPLDAGKTAKLALIGPEADRIKDGGGSSAIDEFKVTTPKGAIETRLGAGKVVFDDGSNAARAAAVAKAADVAIVVVGDRMTEGKDKECLGINCSQNDDIDRDGLIDAVAAAQPRTVVVLQTGGPILTPWRDKVRGLVETWYPGQNGGTAIARVLFGDAEPAGRLPATFPLREADEPVAGDPEKYPGVAETVRYKEGVHIGYRWFDERKLGVAYPFGFGLGYTTFRVSGLQLEAGRGSTDAVASVVVENTGKRAGSAAPQLYVGMPERAGLDQPPLQLKGIGRERLAPGERKRVRFALDERAFSHWDQRADGWRVTTGCYRIVVGQHSRDAAVEGVIGRGAECGGALALPRDARACTSRRAFTIRLPRAYRSARVTVGGKRVRVVRRRGRLTARVDLRGARAQRVTVRAVGRTRAKRAVRQTRIYRTCAKKRPR
ncbi:MAG: GH3 [uncultured Solirubrobacteraceae bacterium]|uniref:GH3 n=1 Tax=uncultured Solirubrobacteraceae bacterium TaxID=1162706 RepID=A0A6J4TVT3_9ACTN|nr:MAG: GH3 [uncultured Solirubrobacteraceae bacterium]